jgi:hypothetical protein
LVACGETETFGDVGNARVTPAGVQDDGEALEFASVRSIDVRIDSGENAGACDDVDATCDVEVDDASITISSMFVLRRHTGRCRRKSDGFRITASCSSIPLPPGEFTVVYGDDEDALAIPSTRPALVIGPAVPPF